MNLHFGEMAHFGLGMTYLFGQPGISLTSPRKCWNKFTVKQGDQRHITTMVEVDKSQQDRASLFTLDKKCSSLKNLLRISVYVLKFIKELDEY